VPRALVTGGSRGIGLAVAGRLAAEGWCTTIAARTTTDLDRACADNPALHAVQADVTCEESVRALFRDGPFDLCVNNAGANRTHQLVRIGTGGLRTHPLDSWESTIRLCLTGVFLVGREAAAAMLRAGLAGTIVNISSAARQGAFGQSAYSAAKAGVDALTRTWSVELGEHGIRVVGVAPGVVDGTALRGRTSENPRHADYMDKLRELVPLRRWCAEEDIADAVVFAARNPSLTGTVLEVDGGGIPRRVH
jgi:3-oxoacyl-[acyl-carrier protein] reductase